MSTKVSSNYWTGTNYVKKKIKTKTNLVIFRMFSCLFTNVIIAQLPKPNSGPVLHGEFFDQS